MESRSNLEARFASRSSCLTELEAGGAETRLDKPGFLGQDGLGSWPGRNGFFMRHGAFAFSPLEERFLCTKAGIHSHVPAGYWNDGPPPNRFPTCPGLCYLPIFARWLVCLGWPQLSSCCGCNPSNSLYSRTELAIAPAPGSCWQSSCSWLLGSSSSVLGGISCAHDFTETSLWSASARISGSGLSRV